jgi:hypothetical protein
MLRHATLAGLAALMATTGAHAALWTNSSGSTAHFTWANGQSDNGLFGNPTVEPTGFTFSPNNFVASSAFGSGANAIKSDRLEVTVTATPASGGIRGVNFGELGDYTIFNGGGVNAHAYVLVQILDNDWTGTSNYSSVLTSTTPTMPVFGHTGQVVQGEWTGQAGVTFDGKTAQSIKIILNNVLQAISGPNGTALIQKKLVDDPDGPGPGIEIVGANLVYAPEPASLAAIGGAVLLVLVRRRKSLSD